MPMTRNYGKRITAITLCIVLVLSTLCTFVCITDTNRKNAQFFAANFSVLDRGKSAPSLSGNGSIRIVSWIRNPEPISENNPVLQIFKPGVTFSADKLLFFKSNGNEDLYTEFKEIRYFLRI